MMAVLRHARRTGVGPPWLSCGVDVLPASEDSITRTTLGTQGGAPRPERAPRPITVRRPAFDFTRIRSRHWFGGDPFISHLLNALSLTFPEGERFFMDAVRQHEPAVESAALKHEIQRFLGQECLHGRAHEAFNDWLSTTGVDPSGIERRVAEGLHRVRKRRTPRYQLAMTCALEHFTAIMAALCLENEEFRQLMDPEVRRLLVWHAIEETEHKAVAFDTYVATGGSYSTRVLAMLITTFVFMTLTAQFQRDLMRQDPDAKGVATKLRGFARMWIHPGWFRCLVAPYAQYFRRDFHPWERPAPGTTAALTASLVETVSKP